MSSLWNNLSKSFREACNACDNGKIEQAREIVDADFPERMQEWFINSNISAESKDAMLLQMMSNELKRSPKALELKDSLTHKLDTKVSHELSKKFETKIQAQFSKYQESIIQAENPIQAEENSAENRPAEEESESNLEAESTKEETETIEEGAETATATEDSQEEEETAQNSAEEAELIQKAKETNLALDESTNRLGTIPVEDIPRMIDTLQDRHSLAWKGDHLHAPHYPSQSVNPAPQSSSTENANSSSNNSPLQGFTFNKPVEQAPAQDKFHQLSAGRISNEVSNSTQSIKQTTKRLARPLTQKYKTKPRSLKIRTIGSKLYE